MKIIDLQTICYDEMVALFERHNEDNNIRTKGVDKNPLYAVIVFSQDNWKEPYTELERSYRVSSDNKAFIPNQLGNSIFMNCINGHDNGVRLDWYNWKIEKIYLEGEKA